MKEYIEREALMFNIAAKFEKHYGKSREQSIHDFYKFVTKKICAAPAADVVEVRHGRWTTEDCELLFAKRAACSVCGKGLVTTDIFDYCPYCGARMDKEE